MLYDHPMHHFVLDNSGSLNMNTGGGICSDNISSAVYNPTVTADQHSSANVQLKDHFSSEKEIVPKVRKPYTITKQRERWKEEEHEKFIEALKLYGRDWRQIEEHVGTKTAVQIRSHAQKFFSKVTRNSNGCSTTSIGCIEIPPPRPKRKPAHPYPRKEVPHSHKVQTRSLSPQLSEKEYQSPTSTVLAASGSDTLIFDNSRIHHDSASPDSSIPSIEPNSSTLDNESPFPTAAPGTENSTPHEKISKNLDLFPNDDVQEKDVSTKEASIQSLKLFGRTVLITDPHPEKQTPIVETCASEADCKRRENYKQISPWNSMVMKSSTGNTEGTWNHGAFYFLQFNNGDNSNQGPGSTGPVSWWSSYGNYPLSFVHCFKQADSDLNPEVDDKETHKDQSWCGSNTGSVNSRENDDKCGENDIQSRRLFPNRDELIGKALSSELISSHEKNTKGFVPYKRCMTERATNSHTIKDAEREEKRIRLCL